MKSEKLIRINHIIGSVSAADAAAAKCDNIVAKVFKDKDCKEA